MMHLSRCACAVCFVLGLALIASGAEVPWNGAEDGKGNPGEAVAPADLKTELTEAQYKRLIGPIEAKTAAAEKAAELYDKEMEKPVEKRDQQFLLRCKDRRASLYLAASKSASRAMRLVKTDAQKAAVRQQFEEPCRQKAIEIYLELAATAFDDDNVKVAISYYRRILAVEKDNAQAKEGLAKVAEKLKQAHDTRKTGGTKGGDSEDTKSWEAGYKDIGRPDKTDWSKIGRPSW